MSSPSTSKSAMTRVQLITEGDAESTPSTAAPSVAATTSERSDNFDEGHGRMLQPGLFPPAPAGATTEAGTPPSVRHAGVAAPHRDAGCQPLPPASSHPEVNSVATSAAKTGQFSREETLFCFDWDDTVLPSSFVQSEGLRLDRGSELSSAHREQLAMVANAAARTLQAAKRHGTVVLVTNAERGWIELSCQKFLPTLYPMLEDVRLVSARTTYEGLECVSPLEWKLRAFRDEIVRHFTPGAMDDPSERKNVFSLGDSVHEREALLRATASSPNCRSKSLKFVERPGVSQLCKQHDLISSSFEQMVHHDGNLDFCIRCP